MIVVKALVRKAAETPRRRFSCARRKIKCEMRREMALVVLRRIEDICFVSQHLHVK